MLPFALPLMLASHQLCTLCRTYTIDEGYLCAGCDGDLRYRLTFSVQDLPIFASSVYDGVIKDAISAFKDANIQSLPLLVHLLYRLDFFAQLALWQDALTGDNPLKYHKFSASNCAIVPIATTTNRLQDRGFYAVGLLAQYWAHLTHLPLLSILHRPTEGVRQRGLSRAQRLDNMTGAFVVDEVDLTHIDTLILFDDVVTTGSTLLSAKETLQAQFPHVAILGACLAHGRNCLITQ